MTMKKVFGIASSLLWLALLAVPGIIPETTAFGTGVWDADRLGNHRAVIFVAEAADAVWVRIPWRRRVPSCPHFGWQGTPL